MVRVPSSFIGSHYFMFCNGINHLLKPYLINNYKKLLQLDNYVRQEILILLIIGNDRIISVAFKIIIENIMNSDLNMKMNRTDLLFKLGNSLIKHSKYILNNDSVLHKVDIVSDLIRKNLINIEKVKT